MSTCASSAARGGAPRRAAAAGTVFPVFCLLWVLTLPLVGHGCHGDDVDHEPAAAPPVRADVVSGPGAKTSR